MLVAKRRKNVTIGDQLLSWSPSWSPILSFLVVNVKLKEKKLTGLKSHDCHMIMQQLLPIALRRSTNSKVTSVLIRICNYFNDICSKTIDTLNMEKLEKEIVITLCDLEKLFPPSFFTIMIHLMVHLATEVKVVGPVQYRWMYPVER